MAATYDLYVGDDKEELMEQATIDKPLCFYSGMGMMLERFESELLALEACDKFDFVIPAEEAYGLYDDEQLIDLPKSIFEVDGKIDERVLFEGNIVPLQDNEGNRINASVVKVEKDTVKVDLNHPLAGENLHFKGTLVVKREADADEIANLFASQGCGGHCGDCAGGCGEGSCGGCGGGCDCAK